MADTADMIRKIQACLNLANNPGATPDEKAAAQARAEILMAKYEIDEAGLFTENRDAGGNVAKDVVLTSFWVRGTGDNFIPLQRTYLAGTLAETMNCRAVLEQKEASADVETGAPIPGGEYLSIVGFRSDVENARNLYNLLVPDIAMAVAKEKQTKENYVKQFAQGYVDEIGRRLRAMRRNVTKAVEEEKGSSMALVLVNKAEVVKSKFDEMYPNLRKTTILPDSRYDGNAQARGAQAAKRADLGGGNKVGGGSRKEIG